MFGDIYRGRKILITGISGFKGSHLAFWLEKLGAHVSGIALGNIEAPSHARLLGIKHILCDIRDRSSLKKVFETERPEIVFHLAAQPIVLQSYQDPVGTFETNVLGTANVLDVCRFIPSVRAAVCVTSDKCYENREDGVPLSETMPMGGLDPYSASKGAAELLIASFAHSFFNPGTFGKTHRTLVASVRAGNVIGGGDWAPDRLVPDAMRAASEGRPFVVRRPDAVRPWQHVLEPLSGYLLLGEKLLEGRPEFSAQGWNFGPGNETAGMSVREFAYLLAGNWDRIHVEIRPVPGAPHEANTLLLDSAKARELLGWHGVWDERTAVMKTALWYKNYYEKNLVSTADDLAEYCADAAKAKLAWSLDS